MDKTDFYTSNRYLFLPKNRNHKVALVVDNTAFAQNSFKLYNPFSTKAKILKKISQFMFVYFNSLAKIIWRPQLNEQSVFINYLEEKLETPLVSSVYYATENDKVVLQLQTPDANIVGYLKYPLNKRGLQHLENEKKAFDILSKKNIVKKYILHDQFNEKPFLLFEELKGEIGLVERGRIEGLLLKLKRQERYLLAEHPRILELKKEAKDDFLLQIDTLCRQSTAQYALVYEHGDFTPWNIINVEGDYVPFDFEYFVEDGLEYFDLIKYYYQIGKLLKQLDFNSLILYIKEQVGFDEIKTLLPLFLMKEILRKKSENEEYEFEAKLLEMMGKQ